MSKKMTMAIVATAMFFATSVHAQQAVYDIITLKNGRGIIKGFINEQLPGKSFTIIPVQATLKIEAKEIRGGKPTRTTIKNDTTTIEVDVIELNGQGVSIQGQVVAEAPGKWYEIQSSTIGQSTYPYHDIEKIGKGVVNPEDNIFEQYGALDVLELEGGQVIRGIIVEQIFGRNLTIKDIQENKNKVVDFNEIKVIGKEAYVADKDIFEQSAFLDVVHKRMGGVARGILVCQIPGESVVVEFPAKAGNSDPIPYADIQKISREVNPYKKKVEVVPQIVVQEPDSSGVCIYKDNGINRQINDYAYTISKKSDQIALVQAPLRAIDVFPADKPITFIIRAKKNRDELISTIRLWNVSVSPDKQTKYITEPETSKDVHELLSTPQKGGSLKAEKYGNSSVKTTITPDKKGEYAITYKDCATITVFSVE